MAQPWFKFYAGKYLADSKLSGLTTAERCCWIALLCLAAQSEDSVIRHLTVDGLLRIAGVSYDVNSEYSEWTMSEGVLDKFLKLELIEMPDPETIIVTNFQKRQDSYLTDTEKKRNYRAKQSQVDIVHPAQVDKSTSIREDKIREDKRRIDNKESVAIATTPSSKTKDFFSNTGKQTEAVVWLAERGVPQEVAQREVFKFISYWTELNKSGTKQRWELQPTFEINRRLATWFSKIKEFNPSKGRERKVWD